MAEKSLRQVNLERVSVLHHALRWTAVGKCPAEFKSMTLGTIEEELRVRLMMELMLVKIDKGKAFVRKHPNHDPNLN